MYPGMRPRQFGLSLLLGLGLGFASISSASATATATQCEDLLTELGSTQAALHQMEQAVEANTTSTEQLRTESATLAATIADKRRTGAAETEISSLVEQRQEALDDLELHEKLRPALLLQRDALVQEVDRSERGYITCVESTLAD